MKKITKIKASPKRVENSEKKIIRIIKIPLRNEEILTLMKPLIPELIKGDKGEPGKSIKGEPGKSVSKIEIKKYIDASVAKKMPKIIKQPEGPGSVTVEGGDEGYNIVINGKKHFVPNAVYGPKLRSLLQLSDGPGTYAGFGGGFLKVKLTEDGWEFGAGGGGSGDVVGPATNSANYIPQWDGADSKILKNGIPTSTFAPALGTDDNYVTDAQLVVIGNTSGTNSGDNATNSQYSGLAASKEDVANKSTSVSTDGTSDVKYPSVKAVKDYADGLVAGLLDYRGAYDASVNTFPAAGGSGSAGAVLKGDLWIISVAGTLGTSAVQIGDSVIANTDTPGQTAGNWNILNSNITYVPEDAANKVTSISGSSTDAQYPSAKLTYDQLALKVVANAAITGATKTKVTYDAKGLVTSGADATTADIADSTNKRYVTDANLTTIGNQSGTNTGDNATNSQYSGLVSNATHTGDATGATALTLATVNSDVGTFTNASITVNAKGLITAASNGTGGTGDMVLASVQSVTGLKTFNKDKMAMKGTSTGVNTFSSANTSSTSYTNTIPAKDGTFAMTNDIIDPSSGFTLGENASLALDPSLSADGKYCGTTRAGTAGAALVFGDLCYLDPTDSRWEKVDGNSAEGADGDARGILGMCVLAAASDGDATNMLLNGVIRADSRFPTLTINGRAYVSETAGDITTTQPTTTDAVIRVVGFGYTADELYFNPSSDFITHT